MVLLQNTSPNRRLGDYFILCNKSECWMPLFNFSLEGDMLIILDVKITTCTFGIWLTITSRSLFRINDVTRNPYFSMGPIFRASCVIVLSLSFVHTSEQRQKIEPSCSGLNTTVRLSDPSLVLTRFDKAANCSSGYFLESFSNRSLNLTLSVQSQLSDFVPFFFGFTFMGTQEHLSWHY